MLRQCFSDPGILRLLLMLGNTVSRSTAERSIQHVSQKQYGLTGRLLIEYNNIDKCDQKYNGNPLKVHINLLTKYIFS